MIVEKPLLIVGAYPGGRGRALPVPGKGDRDRSLANIADVPLCGESGPLIEPWGTETQR